MRSLMGALIVATLAVFAGPEPNAQQSNGAGQDVMQMQAQLHKAMLAQDVKTLDSLVGDELQWVHSSGGVDSKKQYLERIRTGASQWLKLDPHNMKSQVYGDAALVTGELHQTTTGPGRKPADRVLRTIEVYARRNGRWQLAHFQAVRLEPEPAPAAAPR